MQFSRSQLIILGVVGALVLVVLLLLLGALPGLKQVRPQNIELTMWGLKTDEAAMEEVANRYSSANRGVTIEYSGLSEEEYEEVLIDNLAAGTGPDIFLLRNDWAQKHRNKIVPAPQALITPATVSELFPQVVVSDFTTDAGAVYGLPMSIDTLAVVYNRSTFDAKLIAVPPVTWDGVKVVVPRLREVAEDRLEKGAFSAGETSESVENSADILTLIMMQTDSGGGIFNNNNRRISFADQDGVNAMTLYTDFATPESQSYGWSGVLGNSIEAFADGDVAMAAVYHNQLSLIRARNPIINYGVIAFPQFTPESPVNIARYWSMVASNRTANYSTAWDFINFAATDPAATSAYVSSSTRPPALRSLIRDYRQHQTLRVFVGQTLTAQSWPVPDHAKVSAIFDDMIESVLDDRTQGNTLRILRAGEDAINRIITR